MKKIESHIVLQAVPLPLDLLISLINWNIERCYQCFVHPWLILGILISELSFAREHKVNQEDADEVKEDDLDGFPEPDNAFDPVHGVKLEYLFNF